MRNIWKWVLGGTVVVGGIYLYSTTVQSKKSTQATLSMGDKFELPVVKEYLEKTYKATNLKVKPGVGSLSTYIQYTVKNAYGNTIYASAPLSTLYVEALAAGFKPKV